MRWIEYVFLMAMLLIVVIGMGGIDSEIQANQEQLIAINHKLDKIVNILENHAEQ